MAEAERGNGWGDIVGRPELAAGVGERKEKRMAEFPGENGVWTVAQGPGRKETGADAGECPGGMFRRQLALTVALGSGGVAGKGSQCWPCMRFCLLKTRGPGSTLRDSMGRNCVFYLFIYFLSCIRDSGTQPGF